MARFDWDKRERVGRPLVSRGARKANKREAEQLAARLKAGKPTKNKTARRSGAVKVLSRDEIAALGLT